MRLIQCEYQGRIRAARVQSPDQVRLLNGDEGTYGLARQALSERRPLTDIIEEAATDTCLDYAELVANRQLRPPMTHPSPAHCLVSGTGLTHLGSADTRAAMHARMEDGEETLTDSMRIFRMGAEGGKPAPGQRGVQPEWFYKGDGDIVVNPEGPMPVPAFAEDAGEEPEIAGLYLIDDQGQPWRVGYALGNEFSDHVTERHNYLWLAHSKLRSCSFGPELLVGDLPSHLEGVSRIRRQGEVIWEKPFLTGEDNMAHSLANLEYHHFKYAGFRRPGDMHVHYFGTATLSFADGIQTQEGDCFEIEVAALGRPLRNPLAFEPGTTDVTISNL